MLMILKNKDTASMIQGHWLNWKSLIPNDFDEPNDTNNYENIYQLYQFLHCIYHDMLILVYVLSTEVSKLSTSIFCMSKSNDIFCHFAKKFENKHF